MIRELEESGSEPGQKTDASLKKYREFANSLSQLVYEINDHARFTFVNQAFLSLTGYTEEDFKVMTVFQLVAPVERERMKESVLELMRGETTAGNEYLVQRKDGTTFAALFYSMPLIQKDKIVGIRGFGVDITERRLVEAALRESETRYRLLAQNATDVIWTTDMDMKLTYVSPSITRHLGFTVREAMELTMQQAFAPDSFEKAMQLFALEMENESTGRSDPARSRMVDLELVHRNGDYIPFEAIFCFLRDPTGKPTGILSIARNISERRQLETEKQKLEERLVRAEKMEALGTLAGGVAHDLNNVLGAVIGYADLLLMDVDASSSVRRDIEKIMKSGKKAAAIVQDLLTLARRGLSVKTTFNLNKIVMDCMNSHEFEKLASYHSSVRIETDLESGLLNISGSPVHVDKTLFNLISNASEAMPNGGFVTIKTANQYIDKPIQGYDEVREGDYAVLSVSDTGEGISADDLKHIFEPFYTKKVMGRSGTGLGLAVVWGTVKDHNGYINVESKEGMGSTFTLYFPVTRQDMTAEDTAASISKYMGKGESILVVDDFHDQREIAATMLTRLNYNVKSVPSGEEAVAYVKENEVDLMVLDMIMDPGMDGLEAYMQVLELRPKQKAIVVSGFSETERVRKVQELGAGAYVKKPYILENLGLAVRAELDRK